MKVTYLTEDTSIDWYGDYHVNALNLGSLVFENVSDIYADDNLEIHIFDGLAEDVDEFEISDEIREVKNDGYTIDYALYSLKTNYLIGFVCYKEW